MSTTQTAPAAPLTVTGLEIAACSAVMVIFRTAGSASTTKYHPVSAAPGT